MGLIAPGVRFSLCAAPSRFCCSWVCCAPLTHKPAPARGARRPPPSSRPRRRPSAFDHENYERQYGFDVTFKVERMWRGPAVHTIKILTGWGGGDCGYQFERGQRYLVYAYVDRDGVLGTSICTRTRELEHAGEDLAFLDGQPLMKLR
jgi:hypothetical protein